MSDTRRILLVALDQSIVATALPHIVSQFKALSDVSWVASAYFLTQVRTFSLIHDKCL
jgi:MFS family permease